MSLVLVTGSNGFIGSHLVRRLINLGHEVRCLVRSASDLSALKDLRVHIYLGDVRDAKTLQEPVRKVEVVYHLAAQLLATSEEEFTAANETGTRNLLEATHRNAESTIKRFVFVSSQAAGGPGRDGEAVKESDTPRPVSWYGKSKLAAEREVLTWVDRLPVTIVRPSSVYGERERDISKTFGIVASRVHPILGLGKRRLVMVYVEDVVDGIVRAASTAAALGQTYFLNHPDVLSPLAVVRGIAGAMKKPWGLPVPIPIAFLRVMAPIAEFLHQFTRGRPLLTRDKVREMANPNWLADPSKAGRDLGWQASHDLTQGMEKTVRAHAQQEDLIRKMPLEKPAALWLKFVTSASVLGGLIEITSAIGKFYRFDPWWAVFVIVFAAFGAGLGAMALITRRKSAVIQFAVGTVLAGALEILNDVGWLPFIRWEFSPGWPLGITNSWIRSIVLATAGGMFVIAVNASMRMLYRRRMRLG